MKTKNILVGLMLAASAVPAAWAMDADSLKKQALAACETAAKQTPEEYRELGLKTCKCGVEKTDYKLYLSGDTAKIQEDAMKIAKECAAEAGAAH